MTVQMTASGASMRTGPDGAFSLDVLAGTYDLEVIRSTGGSLYTALYARVPEFHISADQTVDLLFPLQAFDIAVNTEAGVPVPAATVGFGNGYACLCPSNFELLPGHPAMVSVSANVKTDPGGIAHVVGLPARDLSVQASAPAGAGFEPYNEILEFGAMAPSAITVVLRSTAALEGFVTAPSGGPARFPFVQLSDGRSSTFYGRYTGSDGRYATDHPPGRYQVGISSSTGSGNTTDHARAYVSDFDLPASGRNQSFTIPGATFPVQVVNSAGDAVAGASVFVSSGSRDQGGVPVDLAPGLRGGATNQSSRVTGADGMANTVIIAGTPTVSVNVQPPTGALLRPYSASVAPSSAGLVVRLPSTVPVNGIVRDAGGTPIAGLTVGVSAADGTGGGITATAGDGSYMVSAPSGPGTLYFRGNDAAATAHLPSGQWYFTTDVDLTGPRTVNVTTPPTSTADVLVVGEEGEHKSGVLAVYGTTAIDVSLGSGLTGKLAFSSQQLEGDGAFRAMLFAGGKHRLSWFPSTSPVSHLNLTDVVITPGRRQAIAVARMLPATTTTTTAPTTTTTTAPGTTTATNDSPAAGKVASGYWMVGSDGKVYAFGDAKKLGDAAVGNVPAVDLEPTATGKGYWVIDELGRVYAFGDAVHRGNIQAKLAAGEKVTSLSRSGNGYWVFTTKGRVLTFGDAVLYGDMSGTQLNGPVLDSIPTPSGKGYYMVASDGGIFTFGDARFYGSMGAKRLNAAVQSLVPDADGVGYWLVASDGGIFAFDAPFRGSMGGTRLNRPVTGMVRFGNGYLMVGEDGGIFNFSDREFHGSLGANPPARPVVSVAVL